jgi:hypothetical protein
MKRSFLDLLDPSNDPEFFWQVISGPPVLFKSLSKKLSISAIINTGCHLKKMSFSHFYFVIFKKSQQHSADAANIQKSNSVNHFNLCAIWKVRIFEGTPAIRNSGKKSATDQKRWQIRTRK